MDNFEWDDPSVDAPPNPGCGIIFMEIVFWGMVVLLLAVKTVDYVINQPVSQIQQQLPEYAEVPDYDRRDNSFDMEIIKESSNDVWYEVTVNPSKPGTSLTYYIVKAKISERLFLTPKVEIYSVIKE